MRVGMGQIHRQPQPPMAAIMRRGVRGIGQTATPINLQLALNNWFQQLSAQPQSDAAVGCGPGGGTPCASPQDAANMVYTYAQSICQEATAAQVLAGSLDPNCADGGQAVAAALYPQVLALFNSFPASVWATEAANAASGSYYGPVPNSCPNGGFLTVGPNGPSCAGSTANQDIQNAPVSIVASAPAAAVVSPVPASAPASVPASSISTTAPSPAAAGAASSSSSTSSTSDTWGFLTETSIDGIPNWMLIAAGVGLVFLLPSLMGGRR